MADNLATNLLMERETWNEAAEVAPGFWIIATHHRPGASRFAPQINNRCLIFRLEDQSRGGEPVLLAVNAVDNAVLPQVHKLIQTTGLPLRYLLSPGGGHSLTLPDWLEALPDAQVIVGGSRIPRLRTGKKLAQSDRFATFDPDNPLPQFKGQLDFVNMDGLFAFREILTPKEGGKDTPFQFLSLLFQKPEDPTDELWLFHQATRSCFGGENLAWLFTEEDIPRLGFPTRYLFKPSEVKIIVKPRPVADAERVARHWRAILDWPIENLFTYHDSLGHGRMGDSREALRRAVEAVGQI